MSNYTPDWWAIVRITFEDQQIDKVLASFYGESDSWRLSSGITKVDENDSHYQIHNHSGNTYTCYKNNEGMSQYAADEFENLQDSVKKGGGKIELLDIHAIL